MTSAPSFDVVVPTVGRESLVSLLDALATARGPVPGRVLVVDDRRQPTGPLPVEGRLPGLVQVLPGPGRGPAAARNVGWRAARAEWVAFLDDDVVPGPDWLEALSEDLAGAGAGVAASQGRIGVPLPSHRRPTDWERNVAGLEGARWATADMAYRLDVLGEVGGFDERFPRAYREDADLGLRVVAAGYRITMGGRAVVHPVRPADRWVSVRLQAGNRDDPLMSALHGRGWRHAAGVPRGRFRRHAATTGAGVLGLLALLAGRRRLAALGLSGWLAGTAELAVARIAPGPRTVAEVTTMVATSAVLPAVATYHRLAGLASRRRLLADGTRAPRPSPLPPPTFVHDSPVEGPTRTKVEGLDEAGAPAPPAADVSRPGRGPNPGLLGEAGSPAPPAAVLLDRDGTLVADVPYNADPERVVPVPGAREALDRLRRAGVALAVVSNQSGVARGLISIDELEAVNRRVEELLGPLGPWLVCVHGDEDGCECRKPAPGLVERAAEALGLHPSQCVVVGDIGADVEAARAAGARAVLVPTPATRPAEVASAPEVAADLGAAVDLLIGYRR